MKNCTTTTNGYILIVTLLMIASMTAVGTYIFLRSTVFIPFMHTMYDREKAKVLAMGGLQIAIQQLSHFDEAEQSTTTPQAAGYKPLANKANKKLVDHVSYSRVLCQLLIAGKCSRYKKRLMA